VEVVIDYCAKFPDGEFKAGKKRGVVDLTTYTEVEGFRQAHEDSDDGSVKTDYESFILAMKNLRGWSQTTAHAEWEELYADRSVQRDSKGYKDRGTKMPQPEPPQKFILSGLAPLILSLHPRADHPYPATWLPHPRDLVPWSSKGVPGRGGSSHLGVFRSGAGRGRKMNI
jgi:hypothetical protein